MIKFFGFLVRYDTESNIHISFIFHIKYKYYSIMISARAEKIIEIRKNKKIFRKKNKK